MRRIVAVLALTFLTLGFNLGAARAPSVAVFPLTGLDPVASMVVAERLASMFESDAIGPDLAPLMTAPIAAEGGFVNPAAALTPGTRTPEGLRVFADALGVPTALSGSLERDGGAWTLTLLLEHDGRALRTQFTAAGDNPDTVTRAAGLWLAGQLGRTLAAPRAIDLRGIDGLVGRARALVGAGFFLEANAILEAEVGLDGIDRAWRAALQAAVAGALDSPAGNPAMTAMASLSSGDADRVSNALAAWVGAGAPPVSHVWQGVWSRSQGDQATASAALAQAASRYDYGTVARAADVAVYGDAQVAKLLLRGVLDSDNAAALLVGSWVAGSLAEADLEDALLLALTRITPTARYPFERRSFIAFDRNDALTAAQALAVAVELEPDSDLYWTNLGWAWYLLGFLDRSEQASERALQIDASQVIARYNLGLVQVVTGRLPAALDTYATALRFDPRVEPEAVVDLQDAERDYPQAVGIPFALAFLLEQANERAFAAAAYDRYLERAARYPSDPGASLAFLREAQMKVEKLRAPLPPIEIAAAPTLSLGRRGPAVEQARPGDPLTVTFEVTTEGETLPRTLEVSVVLRAEVNAEALVEDQTTIDIPSGAIGYVIDTLQIELPVTLAAGTYALEVRARGDDMVAVREGALQVAGQSDDLRRLVGRALVPTALDSGTALVTARDLTLVPSVVWARWVAELQALAELAEEALPAPTVGRFEGQSGGEIFRATQQQDVQDFVRFLLATGARQSTFALADAYAQWVLDGAPSGVNE